MLILAAASPDAIAQAKRVSPTAEQYVARFGGVVVPAGELQIDGRGMTCGSHPTVLDPNLNDFSAAYPKFTILNMRRMQRLKTPIKLWIYEVACAYQVLGYKPAMADCRAVEKGVTAGWLDEGGVREVSLFIHGSRGHEAHNAGPQRCDDLLKCFARASLRRGPPATPKAEAR